MSAIQVEPYEIITKRLIHQVVISVAHLNLCKNVTLDVKYLDNIGIWTSDPNQITLRGDDYIKWGNDDNYIYEYVYAKLGLKPIPAPVHEKPVSVPVPVHEEPVPEPVPVEPVSEEPVPESEPTM